MRMACGVRVQERSAFLQEIVDFSVLITSGKGLASEAAGIPANSKDDFGHFFQGNLFTGSQFFFLLLNLVPEYISRCT